MAIDSDDQLVADDTRRIELPGKSNVEESKLPRIPVLQNHGQVVGHKARLGVGQGASPRQQGDKKPVGIELIGKCFDVKMHYNSKKKIKRQKWEKSCLTLGDFIVNNADTKKDSNMPRIKEHKTETEINSQKLIGKVKQRKNDLKTMCSIIKCTNKFSVLKIEDDVENDSDENINDEMIIKNKPKKYKKIRKIKMKRQNQNCKIKTGDFKRMNDGTLCGEYSMDKCQRTKFFKGKLQAAYQKQEQTEIKNLTELEKKLVLQRIAFVENCKASKASVVIHIYDNIYISRDNFWPYRLRGGADNQADVENYLSTLQESNMIMV